MDQVCLFIPLFLTYKTPPKNADADNNISANAVVPNHLTLPDSADAGFNIAGNVFVPNYMTSSDIADANNDISGASFCPLICYHLKIHAPCK